MTLVYVLFTFLARYLKAFAPGIAWTETGRTGLEHRGKTGRITFAEHCDSVTAKIRIRRQAERIVRKRGC